MPGPTSSGGFKQVSAAASKGAPAPMLRPGNTRESGVDRLFASPSCLTTSQKGRCSCLTRRRAGAFCLRSGKTQQPDPTISGCFEHVSAASQNTTRTPAGGSALEGNREMVTFCESIRNGYPEYGKNSCSINPWRSSVTYV